MLPNEDRDVLASGLQRPHRRHLVASHKAAVASHVSAQDSGELALDDVRIHGALPALPHAQRSSVVWIHAWASWDWHLRRRRPGRPFLCIALFGRREPPDGALLWSPYGLGRSRARRRRVDSSARVFEGIWLARDEFVDAKSSGG
jgi:hypothetical protein